MLFRFGRVHCVAIVRRPLLYWRTYVSLLLLSVLLQEHQAHYIVLEREVARIRFAIPE